MDKTKSWFFENINKTDKLLTRLNKKKKREDSNNKLRNEIEIKLTQQKYKDL